MSSKDIWQWLGPLAMAWGGQDRLREQAPVLLWRATGLASLARALYVDRGVLYLAVESHVVAAELNLLKGKVLARLAEVVPGCEVADLRFQVRAREAPPAEVAVTPPTAADLRRARRDLPPGLPPCLRDPLAEALAWARARDQAILDARGWRCPRCGLVLVKEKNNCPTCGIDRFGAHR